MKVENMKVVVNGGGRVYSNGKYIGESQETKFIVSKEVKAESNRNIMINDSIKEFSINCKVAISDPFAEIMRKFSETMKTLCEALDSINKMQETFMNEPVKHKKGKRLKCWENKRFYQ